MNVLFVTARFPQQGPRGDQLRAFQQLVRLARTHRIVLVCFAPADRPADAARVRELCAEVVVVEPSRLSVLPALLGAVLGGRPLQAALYDPACAAVDLDDLRARHALELVHLQLARLGGLVDRLGDLPCVLDLVDALSLNMARRADVERGPFGRLAAFETRRLLPYERALVDRVAAVAVSAAPDRSHLGRDAITLLPNAVDFAAFPFHREPRQADTVVFVGNLGYFPNVDGVCWLVDAVMPRARALRPALRLRLVGARPDRRLVALATRHDWVDLVGPVESVHAELAAARLAVVPLRAGSGQQLKLLEAMASGTPTVTTSLSVAGIDSVEAPVRHRRQLLVADRADDFADAIVELAGDDALCAALADAARRHVEAHHDADAVAATLDRLWRAAAPKPTTSAVG